MMLTERDEMKESEEGKMNALNSDGRRSKLKEV